MSAPTWTEIHEALRAAVRAELEHEAKMSVCLLDTDILRRAAQEREAAALRAAAAFLASGPAEIERLRGEIAALRATTITTTQAQADFDQAMYHAEERLLGEVEAAYQRGRTTERADVVAFLGEERSAALGTVTAHVLRGDHVGASDRGAK